MKSLIEYINESKVPEYLTVWETVEWDGKSMKDKIVDAINSTIDKTKVIIIKNIESTRAEKNAKIDANIAKSAQNLATRYKRVMKYSDEKREQWIKDKIKELQKTANYDTHIIEDVDRKNIKFSIHSSFETESGCATSTLDKGVDYVAEQILYPIKNKYAEHIKSINICSTQLIGKNSPYYYDVIYCFDDEFEAELAKSVKLWTDIVSAAYASGQYMGD